MRKLILALASVAAVAVAAPAAASASQPVLVVASTNCAICGGLYGMSGYYIDGNGYWQAQTGYIGVYPDGVGICQANNDTLNPGHIDSVAPNVGDDLGINGAALAGYAWIGPGAQWNNGTGLTIGNDLLGVAPEATASSTQNPARVPNGPCPLNPPDSQSSLFGQPVQTPGAFTVLGALPVSPFQLLQFLPGGIGLGTVLNLVPNQIFETGPALDQGLSQAGQALNAAEQQLLNSL